MAVARHLVSPSLSLSLFFPFLSEMASSSASSMSKSVSTMVQSGCSREIEMDEIWKLGNALECNTMHSRPRSNIKAAPGLFEGSQYPRFLEFLLNRSHHPSSGYTVSCDADADALPRPLTPTASRRTRTRRRGDRDRFCERSVVPLSVERS